MRSLPSRTSTDRPACASTTAAASPFGPAPTTTASYEGSIDMASRSRKAAHGVALRPSLDRPPSHVHERPAHFADLHARRLRNRSAGSERAPLGHEMRFVRDDDALA